MPSPIVSKLAQGVDCLQATARYLAAPHRVQHDLSRRVSSLSIELTNICNANCIFCAYQYQSRTTGVMDMDLYRKAIDEYCAMGGGPIGLTPTVGDPLADPRLPERIAYARSKPGITEIGMYSNLISLGRFGADALIDAGLSTLIVSCSGLDPAMYARVYRSTRYPAVIANIESFARRNAERGWPVDVSLDLRVDRPVSEVVSYPDHQRMESLLGPGRIGMKMRYDNWGGRITADQLSGTMRLRGEDWASRLFDWIVRPRVSACSAFYSGLMVYWDGTIGACGCRDVDACELIVGDLRSRTLADAWFGPELERLRADFMTDRIKPLCRACSHYNNLSIYLRARHRREQGTEADGTGT